MSRKILLILGLVIATVFGPIIPSASAHYTPAVGEAFFNLDDTYSFAYRATNLTGTEYTDRLYPGQNTHDQKGEVIHIYVPACQRFWVRAVTYFSNTTSAREYAVTGPALIKAETTTPEDTHYAVLNINVNACV